MTDNTVYTLDPIRHGLATPGCPFDGQLRCKGCGRYIGLWNREGQLIAMEYHGYGLARRWVKVTESTFIGPGMFKNTRERTCLWNTREEYRQL